MGEQHDNANTHHADLWNSQCLECNPADPLSEHPLGMACGLKILFFD